MTAEGRLDRLRKGVVLAVVVVGALTTLTMGGVYALIGIIGGTVAVVGRLLPVSKGSWRTVNIAVLVGCVLVGALGSFQVAVGLALVAWLQVHRSCTGRTPADDRVAILLALLQVLLACIQSISGLLAPLFAAFAVLVPIALVLSHLVESAPRALDPTIGKTPGLGGLWSIGPFTAVLTVVLFFGLPRIQVEGIPSRAAESGLGDKVKLGDLGSLKSNPALALRATVRDADGGLMTGPFYFRGTVFDHYTGDEWQSTLKGQSKRASVGRIDHPDAILQEIVLEPLQDGILVGLPGVVRMAFDDRRRPLHDPNGVWRRPDLSTRLSYVVWSIPRTVEDRPDPLRQAASRVEAVMLREEAWTMLPPNIDPRVGELAERIVTEAGVAGDPAAEALALQQWLRTEYAYTLVPEASEEAQPLSAFLFDTKRGHCEYFATALAVMLRTRGIPARVVGGFYGGEPNPFADWVLVRQSDAHAWVEAWTGGDVWTQYDATPAASAISGPSFFEALSDLAAARWQSLILDYSLETQVMALLDLGSVIRGAQLPAGGGTLTAVGLGLGGTVFGLVAFATGFIALGLGIRFRFGRRGKARVTRELLRARTLVRRRGWDIPEHLPPVEAADWLVDHVGPSAEPLRTLSWLHYEVRYGSADDRDKAAVAREARQALHKTLPKRRRG